VGMGRGVNPLQARMLTKIAFINKVTGKFKKDFFIRTCLLSRSQDT
jgi:hypothetical protein